MMRLTYLKLLYSVSINFQYPLGRYLLIAIAFYCYDGSLVRYDLSFIIVKIQTNKGESLIRHLHLFKEVKDHL